jgi:hypothetical protein
MHFAHNKIRDQNKDGTPDRRDGNPATDRLRYGVVLKPNMLV